MSRFSNLELNSHSEDENFGQEKDVVKDEAYFMAEAQTACEQGEFEHALRAYARVLEYNSQNPAAWTGQVRMLIELGEFREAKVWADKALERFAHDPELLAAKAVALGRTGDLEAALAFSDAAFEERGDTPYIWLARGDVLLAREEPRAEFCFQKALALAPTNWFFHWLASRIHFYYHKFVLALKHAQQAMALDASQAMVWVQVGLAQEALGMLTPARNSIEQALQLNPRCQAAEQALTELAESGLWAQLWGWGRRLFSR
jgi:tetratricopeptide (TPR) repeat protein